MQIPSHYRTRLNTECHIDATDDDKEEALNLILEEMGEVEDIDWDMVIDEMIDLIHDWMEDAKWEDLHH